jgi:hypothetical protein
VDIIYVADHLAIEVRGGETDDQKLDLDYLRGIGIDDRQAGRHAH